MNATTRFASTKRPYLVFRTQDAASGIPTFWVDGRRMGQRGWGEEGLVGGAGLHGFGHFVVYLKDRAFGAVFAVLFYVLALDYREGFHYVVHVVAVDLVQMEKRRVELA